VKPSSLASLGRGLLTPARDVLTGLELVIGRGYARLALVGLGMLLGWWVYVPVHELLHAAGCWAAGGQVTRLEIDTLYGGALLAKIFPFVVGGSAYAGRLSGFDPHGSDWVRIATDLGPFWLTILLGVWQLRRAARKKSALFFGLWLAPALAPFLSLTGDAYEIGAIVTTRLAPWVDSRSLGLLRGDDLGLRISAVSSAPHGPWGGLVLGAFLGLTWAFATYGLGAAFARLLGQPALRAGEAGGPTAPPASSRV
jgi:hypothetical protein